MLQYAPMKRNFETIAKKINTKNPKLKKTIGILFIFLFGLFVGLQFRNIIPAATVNGEKISRPEFLEKLVKTSGQPVLNAIITEKLVYQEAKKRNIVISSKEVNAKMAELEKQLKKNKLTLKDLLISQNRTKSDLEKEIESQLIIEKMFKDKLIVTSKDVDLYFIENRIQKGEGAIYESQLIAIRKEIYKRKLRDFFVEWMNNAQKKAKINLMVKF